MTIFEPRILNIYFSDAGEEGEAEGIIDEK